ncbi:MAG: Spy/CpxP family protein refolding chaperone [Candidatus Korobacteraceae bacterium]
MRSKFWMVAVAMLALIVGGVALLSYAQESATSTTQEAWHGRHGRMAYMARELNLTDAQKAQIKQIFQANKATGLPLMQQMAANKKAMLEATANGSYDQAKIQQIANQQAQLMSQLMVQKQAIRHQIYTQVLTPDQRAKAEELRAQAISRIDSRMQKLSQAGENSSTPQ